MITFLRQVFACLLVAVTTGCGGGVEEPAAADGLGIVIDAAGGQVDGPQGASVLVPAGALASTTPIALAVSDEGAPALPAGSLRAGDVFALTPHGTRFQQPVTVRLPAGTVAPGTSPRLFKTNDLGAWELVPGAVIEGGFVRAQISSFSWFAVIAIPPTITQQPAAVSVQAPAEARFDVVAIGSPPFTYLWQRSRDGLAWDDIPGANQASVRITPTAASDDGLRLRVIVANPDGPTTSMSALLTVRAPTPTIPQQPADVTVDAGDDAVFNVTASGSGLAYQWERSDDAGATWTALAGETNASLLLAGVQAADTGARLRVQVGSGPQVTSSEALLTVRPQLPTVGNGAWIAAGNAVSLARRADGSLVAWGSNGNGALGDGSPLADRGTPGSVSLADALTMAGFGRRGAAIDASGRGWAWGSNPSGALGIGATDERSRPTALAGSGRYQAVAVGSDHALWLRGDGQLEVVGDNRLGALALPATVVQSSTPVALSAVATWTLITAGSQFSVGVRSEGSVWTWGSNANGQFGRSPDTFNAIGQMHQILYLPLRPRALAAGHRHVLAVDANGHLWSWGETTNGKLGQGAPLNPWGVPLMLALPGNFIAVAAGAEHSLALRDDGMVFAWGIDETGQLGQGRPLGMSNLPLPVPGLPRIRAIAAGGGLGHSLALAEDGSVWTWGRNDSGQLGRNGRADSATPGPVPGLNLN